MKTKHLQVIKYCKTFALTAVFLGAGTFLSNAQISIETIAGNPNYSDEDSLASKAVFNGANAIVRDKDGNWYVAEKFGHVVKKIDANTSKISKVLGTGVEVKIAPYASWGNASSVFFDRPSDLEINSTGDKIYILSDKGTVGRYNISSNTFDSIAYFATAINGMALYQDSIIFLADLTNHLIRTVNVNTLETGILAGSGSGNVDAKGVNAKFKKPYSLDVYNDTLYVADDNKTIRKINLGDTSVTTIAGFTGIYNQFNINTIALGSAISTPKCITVDQTNGDIYLN